MSSPDWDNNPDGATVKDLYPIGSILILDHPLENVTTWFIDRDPVVTNPVLTVEWKGMIWEYINDITDPASSSPSNRFILTNQKMHVTLLHEPHDQWRFDIWPEHDEHDKRTGFNGSNIRILSLEQIPSHDHGINSYYSEGGSGAYVVNYQHLENKTEHPGLLTAKRGGRDGVTQPINVEQYSYRSYMYRRIG